MYNSSQHLHTLEQNCLAFLTMIHGEQKLKDRRWHKKQTYYLFSHGLLVRKRRNQSRVKY